MSTKQVRARVKMRLKGGAATPAPPVGSCLGQYQVPLMDFCKKFNALTASRKDETVPVEVTVFTDKTYEFVTKGVPVSELIFKKAGIAKGSGKVGSVTIGKISWAAIEEIAKQKMADLNANDLEGAKKMVAGSAKSIGLQIVD